MSRTTSKKPQNPALGMYLFTAIFGGTFLYFGFQEARYSLFGVTAAAKVTHKTAEWRSHKGGSHQVFVLDYSYRDKEGKERVGHDEVNSRWSFGADETVPIEYIPGANLSSRVKGARNVSILLWIFGVFTAIGGLIAWLLRRSHAKAAVELEPLTSVATDPNSDVPKFDVGSLVCRYAGWMGKPVSVIVDRSTERIHFQNCFTRRKFLAVSAEPWFSCSFRDLTAAFPHNNRGVHSLVIVTEMGRAWISDDASDYASLCQTMKSIVPHGGERFNSDHPLMAMLYLGAALAGFFLSWWAMPSSTSDTMLGFGMLGGMIASAITVHLLVAWATSIRRSGKAVGDRHGKLFASPPGYLGLAGVIIGFVLVGLLGVVGLGTKALFIVTIGLAGAILGVLLNPAKPNEDEQPPKKDTSDRTEDSAVETSASDQANSSEKPNPAKLFVMVSGGIGLTSCLLLIWHFAFAKPTPVAVATATTTVVTQPPIQPAAPVQPATPTPVTPQPPPTKVTLPATPPAQPAPANPVANGERQPIQQLPNGVELIRPSFLTPERRQQNLLVGGTFEGDAASKWKLESFRANKLSGAMEEGMVKEGQQAAVLRTTINDDTRFSQTVTIQPRTRYLLSGWIKTKDVEIDKDDRKYGKAGATLSIWGGYEHSRSLVGTNDWTYSTLTFDSRDRTEVAVLARLGYWYSTASGEAWFDDLCLIPIGPSPVRPTAPAPAATITTNKDWKGWSKDAPPPAIAPFDATQAKQHQEAWAKHLGVPVEYTNSIGMKFRLIPPGEFTMGGTPAEIEAALKNVEATDKHWQACMKTETPQHRVVLTKPIYVGTNEVLQGEYEKVMGHNPSNFAATGPGKATVTGMATTHFPVERVSRNEATEFCAKLSVHEKLPPFNVQAGSTRTEGTGYRLLSEAEWEFACRAGTFTKYWIGDQDGDLLQAGWIRGNAGVRTHAAGGLRANPFGLSDMHGNVWEWVQDGWNGTYYAQFQNKPAIDPVALLTAGSEQLMRGGDWNVVATYCRSSTRFAYVPPYRYVGFRVSLTVEAVKAALANPVQPANANAR